MSSSMVAYHGDKIRRLAVSADLFQQMICDPRPQTWRVTKNRLPEDARIVRVDFDDRLEIIYLWIKSIVFQETDPIDLPAVEMELVR